MGLIGLWSVASLLLVCAAAFGWVTVATSLRASSLARRSLQLDQEDLVRRACADLDGEDRRLLRS